MNNSKRPIQSRTLWFNLLSVLAIVLTDILASTEMRNMLGGYIGVLMVAGSVVNAMLRMKTTMPISNERPKLNPLDQALKDDNDKIIDGFKDF